MRNNDDKCMYVCMYVCMSTQCWISNFKIVFQLQNTNYFVNKQFKYFLQLLCLYEVQNTKCKIKLVKVIKMQNILPTLIHHH